MHEPTWTFDVHFFICIIAIRVRLGGSLLLFVQPVRDSLEGTLGVGHHVLDALQLLLCWVDDGVLCHCVAVIIQEDAHGAMTHWRRLCGKKNK